MSYTKEQLQTSHAPKTATSVFQPDHTGNHMHAVNTHPRMHGPAGEAPGFSGVKSAVDHPGNLARDGKPKSHRDVPVHGDMRSRTSPLPGMLTIADVYGAPDAVSQPAVMDPLSPSQAGKHFPIPENATGMRSRVGDGAHTDPATRDAHGRQVLTEALAASGKDHPANMGRR